MVQFHETEMGRRFYQGHFPKLVDALSGTAATLKKPAPACQIKPDVPENFLSDLYLGNYDPSDFPTPAEVKKLELELTPVESQLRASVSSDAWKLVERYRWLLDARGIVLQEQAFAAGFRSAMTMLAAGLSRPAASDLEVKQNGRDIKT